MKPLHLDDTHFFLGLRHVSGTIQAGLGFPVFYCEELGTISNIEGKLSADYLGAHVDAAMRSHSNELVLNPTEDDMFLEDFCEDDMDITDPEVLHELKDLLDEQKLRLMPNAGYPTIMCVVAIIMGIVFAVLKHWLLLIIPALILGVSAWDLYGIAKLLSQRRIYDADGNWVDLDTGHTNLAGGYTIKTEEEANTL